MMKKIWIQLLFAVLFLTFSSSTVYAIGFGFYAGGAVGSADWEEDRFFLIDLPHKFSTDTSRKAIGVTLDTGLSAFRFFNYHLNIGREWWTSKKFIARDRSLTPGPDLIGNLELKGMVLSNTFGFGGAITDSIRLWIGPEIRWHWVDGSLSAYNVDGAGFGFGPSVGVNFNFPGGMTLLLKAGYIMSNYSLDGSGILNGNHVTNDYDVEEDFTYVNLEFLFRSLGDR